MNKNVQAMKRAFMHKNIPYRYCFEEGGVIEIEGGIYTRTYRFMPPNETVRGSYHSGKTRMLMEDILQKLAEKEDAYQHLRTLYNKVLQDNCDIGHNNFTREVYLTLALEADVPDAALEQFVGAEQWLRFSVLFMGIRFRHLRGQSRLPREFRQNLARLRLRVGRYMI